MRSRFSNNFPKYLSMTSSNFCRIAGIVHLLPIYRSSRSQMLFIIYVLKRFTICSGKYLCSSLFLIKFRCFLVNIARFLRTAFYIEHLRWMLLDLILACERSRLAVFCKKDVHRNFAKFRGKHKKEKKEALARCFPANFANFLRTPFITEDLQWLLLCMSHPISHILSRPLTGYLILHFPIENIIQNEYSKLTSTWYIHCFKSCYCNFLLKNIRWAASFEEIYFHMWKFKLCYQFAYLFLLLISNQNFMQEYFLFI